MDSFEKSRLFTGGRFAKSFSCLPRRELNIDVERLFESGGLFSFCTCFRERERAIANVDSIHEQKNGSWRLLTCLAVQVETIF